MLRIIFWVLSFFLIGSCNTRKDSRFPKEIRLLEVRELEKSRGNFLLNDSIVLTGNYFRRTPFILENSLHNKLKIGDIILNPKDTEDYLDIVKKKTLDTIRYYKPIEVNGEWQLAK